MSEFYTVRQRLATIGNYANIDEAEIKKVLIGKNAVVITQNLNSRSIERKVA